MPSFPRTLGLVVVGVAVTTALTGCGSGLITRDLTRVPAPSASPSSSPTTPSPSPTLEQPAPTPEPVVIPTGIAAYGDSVMLGAKAELTARGVSVDAVESRQFHSGVKLVRSAADKGTLPRNVVVHLGTNVRVADWAAASNHHIDWFYSDGIHTKSAGSDAYAALIKAAMAQ